MRNRNIIQATVYTTAAFMLSGCGDPNKPSAETFKQVIGDYLATKPSCTSVPGEWPSFIRPGVKNEKLQALETIGLIKSTLIHNYKDGRKSIFEGLDYGALPGIKRPPPAEKPGIDMLQFDATDEGQKHLKIFPMENNLREKYNKAYFCYGTLGVDRVDKWDLPKAIGEYKEVEVTYFYKVVGTAPWAQQEALLAAAPEIRTFFDGVGKTPQRIMLKLTSKGWEVVPR